MNKKNKIVYLFTHSIRMKFIASFSLLVLIFMSILSLILYCSFYNLTKISINEQLEHSLKSAKVVVETALNSVIQSYCRNKIALFNEAIYEAKTSEDIIRKTRIFKGDDGSFIYLINPKGDVVYTTDEDINFNTVRLKDGDGLYYFMNIINAAKNLNDGEIGFKYFRKARNNEAKYDKAVAAYSYLRDQNMILVFIIRKSQLSYLLNPDDFREHIVKLKTGNTGTIEIFNSNLIEIIHSKKMFEKRVYKNNMKDIVLKNKNGELEIVEKLYYLDYEDYYEWGNKVDKVSRIYKYCYIDELDWYIASGVNRYEAFNVVARLGVMTGIVTFVFIVLFVLLFIFLSSRIILDNLVKLKHGVDDFANKDFSIRVNIKSEDEIGELAYSFNNMAETIQLFTTYLEEIIKEKTKDIIEANKNLSDKNKIIEDQLFMARKVQANLIPSVENLMKDTGINVGVKYESMENIGGDLLDVIKISDDKIGVLMADVSGHGVPAALIASMAKVSFNVKLMNESDLLKILNDVNKEISNILVDMCYFLTAFVGIMDLKNGLFTYCNAGHIPGILQRGNGKLELLDTKSMCIGITDNPYFKLESVSVKKDDRLILITDGIIEATDNNNDLYSTERLLSFVQSVRYMVPSDLVNALYDDVNKFSSGKAPSDDKAILCIDF